MPERNLWTGNPEMESMSSGSCDSVMSITSNHSAFSDGCYDHLSAEERECLIFLEETIDSLDVEVDSGVSTDELERVDEASKQPEALYTKTALPKSPYDTFPKSPVQQVDDPKSDACRPDLISGPVLLPNSGFRSLPRNVQAPREGSSLTIPRNIAASCTDVSRACDEKLQSSLSERPLGESQREGLLQNLLHIPPPEPFQDEKLALEQSPVESNLAGVISEDPKLHEVDSTVVKKGCENFEKTEELVLLQELSPGPEGVLEQNEQDDPSSQQQNVQCEKRLSVQKLIQEMTHGYQEKTGLQEFPNLSTVKAADLYSKQGPPIAPKPRKLPPNIILKRGDGSVLSTSSAECDPKVKTPSLTRNTDAFNVKSFDPREHGKARQEALMKLGLKAKPDVLSTSPLRSSGFPKPSEFTTPKATESTTSERAPNVQTGTIQNIGLQDEMRLLSTSPEKSSVTPKSREGAVPKANMENVVKHGKTEIGKEKKVTSNPVVSWEKTQVLSTSPVQSFGFPKPREVSVMEGVTRESKAEAADKRCSSYLEPGAGLRLPEGSLPGLRHFNFKSNTLERSGIGVSSYADNDDQSRKSSGSAFQNVISNKFSSSFLRNNRPRPASLGTGKDFSNLQNPRQEQAEPAKNENRRSFPLQNLSRSSRPGISVKITPKGSSNEEHRREALIKLGLLK